MTTTTRPRRRALLPGLGLLLSLLFLVTACSGGSGDSVPTSASEGGGALAEDAPLPGAVAPKDSVQRNADGFDFGAGASTSSGNTAPGADIPLQTRAVISTGTVTLRSEDVGQARFDVQKVVDAHRGEISDEQTATDTKGRVDRSRLVIRVPSEFFDEVMQDLGKVAELRSAKRSSEDVTTEVIDIGVRVRAQEKSLERIELLLARAKNLREIIAIESQLTRRQAELDSLKAQQAYLADQTSLSTITLSVERTPEKAGPAPDPDTHDAGFLTGLSGGWKAMKGFLVGLATVAGALLPWAVLALLLAVPGWPLVRRLRRRPVAST